MDKIVELLTRGVAEVIEQKHLAAALKSKKTLRVKLGIDPTSPNIHLGRAVLLLKLRAFQELGHTAIYIVGDFTGLIGDSSDKEAERPMLTEAQIKTNMANYFQQAYKVLDKKKTEVHFNSEWLKKLGFIELAKMANLFGLHEFESREVIARRMKAGKRVSFHELMYPLMQGYDSVAVKADVELGGTDQRFNLLAGRRIQPLYGQEPQDIVMTVLMEGTDGRKMSSSWGNVINITDEANDIFGKVMSIDDSLIKKYFVLATRVPLGEIDEIIKFYNNPRDQKFKLAKAIVALYYNNKTADTAEKNFKNKFGRIGGEIKADINVSKQAVRDAVAGPSYTFEGLLNLLVRHGLASSKSEVRRKIAEGAVEISGEKIGLNQKVFHQISEGDLIRVGRKFLKVK